MKKKQTIYVKYLENITKRIPMIGIESKWKRILMTHPNSKQKTPN